MVWKDDNKHAISSDLIKLVTFPFAQWDIIISMHSTFPTEWFELESVMIFSTSAYDKVET